MKKMQNYSDRCDGERNVVGGRKVKGWKGPAGPHPLAWVTKASNGLPVTSIFRAS